MATVGQNVPRLEGSDKVTGRARYVDDYQVEGVLYGTTIRSPVAHARLLGVRFDPSFDWSDIVRVGPEDIPGPNVVTLIVDDQPALAEGELLHATEPVVLLACEDPARLAEATRHVHLELEELEPVFDPLKSEVVLCELGMGKGDVDAAMASCEYVVEGSYYVGHQEQMYIEPQGMIAAPRPDGGVRILGSLQCPYYIHKALKRLLGLSSEQVEVEQATTGGGFGGKEEYPSMIAAHAALLALKAGRPVKIIYERTEDVISTTKRHPTWVRIRHGVNRDGTLVAVDAEVVMDGGAYATLSKVVLSRAIIHTVGPYRCENVRVQGRVMQTHTPPNGAFRGFGAPQVTFAYERQMDKIAEVCGISPLEVRQRNYLLEGDETSTGQRLTVSVGSTEVLELALEVSNYLERREELSRPQTGALRRGIGLAFFFHGDGFTGGGDERMPGEAAIDLTASGQVRIRTGSTEIGQGTRTIFPQIVSEALGVPVDQILFEDTNTSLVPDSGPTVASRTTMIVGKVLEQVSRELSETMGNPEQPWEQRASTFLATHQPLTVSRQYRGPGGQEWDEETYSGDAYPCYSWACDVAEVTVDLDTGDVKVDKLWLVQDIGKAIHPKMCEGQVEGGTLQGVGYALLEQVEMREGRQANHRMTDYIIPTSLDSPPMETHLVEVPYPHGPFGAKGVGELPMDGIGPAIMAAIEHATGIFVERQPALPEAILELLQANGLSEAP